jgi:hypothetical protein
MSLNRKNEFNIQYGNLKGVDSQGNEVIFLNSQNYTQYVSGGGGSTGSLSNVLDEGNTSGPNDIVFDDSQGLLFDNSSRLREGTIDAGLGGNGGIAQICGLGYELKWEGGVLYVMNSSGNQIRQSLYNFTTTPTTDDDDTKGYVIGSIWSLDDLTNYVCSDNSTGAAVWDLVPGSDIIDLVVELSDSDITSSFETPAVLVENTDNNKVVTLINAVFKFDVTTPFQNNDQIVEVTLYTINGNTNISQITTTDNLSTATIYSSNQSIAGDKVLTPGESLKFKPSKTLSNPIISLTDEVTYETDNEITGDNSGATAKILTHLGDGKYVIEGLVGTFQNGELITSPELSDTTFEGIFIPGVMSAKVWISYKLVDIS